MSSEDFYEDFVRRAVESAARCRVESPDILAHVFGLPDLRREGTWVEFGVASGGSLAQIAAARGSAEVWGFDTFRGLPEPWRPGHPVGEFAQDRIPWPPDGARLVVGRFEDVLPCWRPRAPVTLAHVDCDLYSAAKCALAAVRPHLVPGSYVVFDELFDGGSYPEFAAHELRALWESGIAFDWVAAHQERAAIRVR